MIKSSSIDLSLPALKSLVSLYSLTAKGLGVEGGICEEVSKEMLAAKGEIHSK
jgi:hypothetical protein